ncbi:MAG: gliding motility-associated C-terminal domain-containing protein [Bacteroidales bacterium]|nr:gliding motility-associated C-terminal domain-containing protein [Bacteroidales bacterium]
MIYINKLWFLFIFLIFIELNLFSQVTVNLHPTDDTIIVCAESFVGLYAEVTGGTSPYTYHWYGADSLLLNNVSPFTTFLTDVPGTYLIGCEVTDGNGNTAKDSIIIIVNPIPPLTVSTELDSLCIGDSITLFASGANIIYWANSDDTLLGWGNSITLHPLNSSEYFVVGSTNNCHKFLSIIINVYQPPTVNAGNDITLCSLGNVSLNASATDYTSIHWTSSGTGSFNNPNDLNAIYTPSLQDWNNGSVILTLTAYAHVDCPDATDQLTINFIDIPDLILSTDTTICEGSSVNIVANGANSYLWSEGSTTSSITVSPLANTTYYVTGYTDICHREDSFIVYVNPAPVINLGNDTTICYADTITISATAGYTDYLWNTGDTTNSIIVIPSDTTTYIVTVTNTYGCTASDDITINVRPDIGIDAGLDQSICEGQSAILSASGGISYQWSTGETSATITVTPNDTTVYYVTGTDGICNDVDSVVVNVYPNMISLVTTPDTQVCIGNSINLEVHGAQTYLWSTGQTDSLITVVVLGDSTYYVTGYAYGCQREDSVVITQLPLPLINLGNDTTICYADTITISATAGYTDYLWNTGETTNSIIVIPSDTTTYIVTVTNTYGCTASDDITINVRPDIGIDAGIDQSICEGQSAILSASGGISYQWSTGETTATITVTPSDTTVYYVTGTDGICIDIDSVVVNVYPNMISLVTTPDTQVCIGNSINLEVHGAQTYLWSTGQTDSLISVVVLGDSTYYVTGYAYGCQREDSVVITVSLPFTLSINPTDTTVCPGSNVSLYVSGATNYLWNTGDTGSSIVVIPYDTTIYSVTGYDSGCTAQISAIVNTYPVDMVTIESIPPICIGDSTQLIANGTGIIYWNIGDTTNSIWVSPTNDTTYIANMIDTNGCITSDTINVIVSSPPSLTLNYTSPACINSYINISAQNADYYLWSTGDSTANINIYLESDTIIYVTATNIYGCSSIDSVNIIADTSSLLYHSADDTVCQNTILGLWANGPDTIIWSTGDTGNFINPTIISDTTFYISGISGSCTSFDSITINIFPPLAVDAGIDTTVMAGTSAFLHGTIIGGGIDSIYWLPADSMIGENTLNPEVIVDTSTYFLLTVIDTNGCTWTDVVFVDVIPYGIYIDQISDTTVCSNDSITLLVNHLFGGTPPFIYQWIISSDADTIYGNPVTILPDSSSFIYLSVTDSEGFVTTDTFYLSVVEQPQPTLPDTLFICENDIVILDPQTIGTCYWSTGDTSNTLEILVTQDSTIYLSITNNICTAYDTTLIYMKPLPYLFINPASDSLCLGDTAVFVATSDGNILWSNGSINDTISFEAIENDSIFVVADLNGCYTSNFATIYIYEVPEISVITSAWNNEVLPGEPLTLEILPDLFNHYIVNYSDNSFTDNHNTFTLFISPGGDSIYITAVTDEGCISNETIFINSRKIPNGFTPNNDNINDKFMPGVPIKILNRWGQIVYEGDDGWDGTINNRLAVPGTYYYIIELKDENGKVIKTYNGDVLLIKK